MVIYRFVLIASLLLVRRNCCAPTASVTENKVDPSTAPSTNPGNSTKENTTVVASSTFSRSNGPFSLARPTMTMEKAIERVIAGNDSTEEMTTKKEDMVVEMQNTSLMASATSSINAANSTKVVEDNVPSSILYPICSNYLGIHNKQLIKDDQISASSTLNGNDLMKFINSTLEKPEHDSNETSTSVKSNFTINGNMTAAHDGRLGNMNGSWCASGSPLDSEYLIVDLGQIQIVEGVITQGRPDSDNWVTEYSVSYSSDKRTWLDITKDNKLLVFKGNKDRNSIVVGSFPHRIATKYIKFTPKSFHGKLMCMRVEAIGCHPDAINVAKNQPVVTFSVGRNLTFLPEAVDGKFLTHLHNETCIRTQSHSSPWIRLDLRRSYHVREIFISNQDHKNGWDMWDFEARVGKSLDNEGNDNALCSPLYTLIPGQIGTIVCKNNTVGRYVNVRIGRNGSHLSLCEIAVIGVAETIVKMGLDDIADSLKTGSDEAGDMASNVVGGLFGKLQKRLQEKLGKALLGQGMGMLAGMRGQGMGMWNNLGGQGMGMLSSHQAQGMGVMNNFQGQGVGMANKIKDQGLEMANKIKEQGLEMTNKMKEQGLKIADKMKAQGLEMAKKAKEKGLEMGKKAKEEGLQMANKLQGKGMAMANDLENQGMGMMGNVQGQVNQEQDKFKKKLKELLEKGKDYLEIGKEEVENFKKKGYIETGKEYMDIGLGMTMDGIAFVQEKLVESLSNIAGDMTKQMTTRSEYDTSGIKGFLDNVDPVPVRNFVEEAKPKIGEFIDEMQKIAKKYIKIGIEKAKEAKEEIESEAENAKNDATNHGQSVTDKTQAAGEKMANKAQADGMMAVDKAKAVGVDAVKKVKSTGVDAVNKVKDDGMDAVNKAKDDGMDAVNKAKDDGMDAVNKAKDDGMGAVNKAKDDGMDAVNKAKDDGMDAVNKAKDDGMEIVDKAKSVGMGTLDKAKGLGTGVVGGLQNAGMGMLGQFRGLGMATLGQLRQTGIGAVGNFQSLSQGMLGQLADAGRELVKKVKNKGELREIQQIQMLLQLKKIKEMNELEDKITAEQDLSWKQFEELNNEMEDKMELEEIKLNGGKDLFNKNDVPRVGGTI